MNRLTTSAIMYSNDLRWRVVYLHYFNGLTKRKISERLFTSLSTVTRILSRYRQFGDVQCHRVGRRIGTSLHIHEQFILMEAILQNPSLTLAEILRELSFATGGQYDVSTMSRTLRTFGLTRKRVSIHAYFCQMFSGTSVRRIWT